MLPVFSVKGTTLSAFGDSTQGPFKDDTDNDRDRQCRLSPDIYGDHIGNNLWGEPNSAYLWNLPQARSLRNPVLCLRLTRILKGLQNPSDGEEM